VGSDRKAGERIWSVMLLIVKDRVEDEENEA
jgi:hypothetical protein